MWILDCAFKHTVGQRGPRRARVASAFCLMVILVRSFLLAATQACLSWKFVTVRFCQTQTVSNIMALSKDSVLKTAEDLQCSDLEQVCGDDLDIQGCEAILSRKIGERLCRHRHVGKTLSKGTHLIETLMRRRG